MRPDGDAAGRVDDLDRLRDGRPAAGHVGRGAGDQVGREEGVAAVDALVGAAVARWRGGRARRRPGAGGRSACPPAGAPRAGSRRARSPARAAGRPSRRSAARGRRGSRAAWPSAPRRSRRARSRGCAGPRARRGRRTARRPGVKAMPWRAAAARASGTPSIVSWSVNATSSVPAAAAWAITSAAGRAPSEWIECDWRSKVGGMDRQSGGKEQCNPIWREGRTHVDRIDHRDRRGRAHPDRPVRVRPAARPSRGGDEGARARARAAP